jgi:putative ABC transport system ATP-binding protein
MLELEGVVKHYRGTADEVPAIDGVSLSIAPGEIVAVQGPSGSGKTTLLLLIAALLKPDEGTIRFDGRDIGALSNDQACDFRMREVGFISQTARLMSHVSAIENAAADLMLGGVARREAEARVLPYLERVGLGDRLAHTPEELSAGQRQRVALAGALATEPKLILPDEPTGNLDSEASLQTIELLAEIAHDSKVPDECKPCVLLVTHDPDVAALAGRRLTLRDGKLSEAPAVDTPEDFDMPDAATA